MATFTIRNETVTTRRTTISLPAETNWTEIYKALAACEQSLGDRRSTDDAVKVTADEDGIRFTIEQESTSVYS